MSSRHVRREEAIGRGAEAFARARTLLFAYGFYPASLVTAPGPVVADMVLHQKIRVGPLRFDGPVRVIEWWDEATRAGYRYEALPGHVERGHAEFELALVGDEVRFRIESRSEQAHWLARLGAPLARRVQQYAYAQAFEAMRRACGE